MDARPPFTFFRLRLPHPPARRATIAIVAAALALASLVPAHAQSVIIQGWLAANTVCKGGVPDDPKTLKACKQRDSLNDRLKRKGCEYHADGDWWRCPH
jgi:hypothetical protein